MPTSAPAAYGPGVFMGVVKGVGIGTAPTCINSSESWRLLNSSTA